MENTSQFDHNTVMFERLTLLMWQVPQLSNIFYLQ